MNRDCFSFRDEMNLKCVCARALQRQDKRRINEEDYRIGHDRFAQNSVDDVPSHGGACVRGAEQLHEKKWPFCCLLETNEELVDYLVFLSKMRERKFIAGHTPFWLGASGRLSQRAGFRSFMRKGLSIKFPHSNLEQSLLLTFLNYSHLGKFLSFSHLVMFLGFSHLVTYISF